MNPRHLAPLLTTCALLLAACGPGEEPTPDASNAPDASVTPDAGAADGGSQDTGGDASAVDASGEDAGDEDAAVADGVVADFAVADPVEVGVPVVFDASATMNPRGEELTYAWAFGDGATLEATQPRVEHVYREVGEVTVTLTVTGDGGRTSVAERVVSIVAPQAAPGTVELRGRVVDMDGAPLDEVQVFVESAPVNPMALTAGDLLATTGADGSYVVDVARGAPVVLRLVRNGYVDQFARVDAADDQEVASTRDGMIVLEELMPLADAAAGGVLEQPNMPRVEVPAGALVDAETGDPVEGLVGITATPIDLFYPERSVVLPGTYEALTVDGRALPASMFGAVSLSGIQRARLVELGPAANLTVDIPAPASLSDGATVTTWWFDREIYRWIESGAGTVQTVGGQKVVRAAVDRMGFWTAGEVGAGAARVPVEVTAGGAPVTESDETRVTVTTHDLPRRGAREAFFGAGMPRVAEAEMPTGRAAFVEVEDRAGGAFRYGAAVVDVVEGISPVAVDLVDPGAGAPALPAAPESVTLEASSPYRFYAVTVTDDDEVVRAFASANAAGQSGELLLREATTGEVMASAAFAREGASLRARVPPGDYLVQARTTSPGGLDLSLSGAVEATRALEQGVPRDLEIFGVSPVRYGVTPRRGRYVVGQVFNEELSDWRLALLDGAADVGVLQSSRGDLSPGKVRGAGDYAFEVRTNDPNAPGLSYSVVWSRVRTTFAFMGALNVVEELDVSEPGMTWRLPVVIAPDHHYILRAVAPPEVTLPSGATAASTPPLVAATLSGLGIGSRSLSDASTTFSGNTGARLLNGQLFVGLADGATGAITMTVEQSPEVSTFKAGDPRTCPDADGSLELGLMATTEGGRIELCPGVHTLPTTITKQVSIVGEPGRGADTRVRFPSSASAIGWNTTTAPLELRDLTLECDGAIGVPFVRLNNIGADLTLAGVTIDLQVDRAGAMFDIQSFIESPPGTVITLDGLEVVSAGGFVAERHVVANIKADLVMRDLTFMSPANNAVNAATTRALTLEGATISGDFTGQIVQLSAGEDVLVADNVIATTTPSFGARTVMGVTKSDPGAAGAHTVAVRGNHFQSGLSTGGTGHALDISLAGDDDVDLLIENNLFDAAGATSGMSYGALNVYSTFNDANVGALTVRNNVFIGVTERSRLGRLNSFGAVEVTHNSALLGPGGLIGWTLSGANQVLFANNAVAFTETAGTTGVLPISATLDGGDNLFFNATTPYSTPQPGVTDDLVGQDPLWDPTTLLPGVGSPLIDAGRALNDPGSTPINGGARTQGAAPDIGAHEQ